jgi:O-succinylbenzoic acid--CoA ligase
MIVDLLDEAGGAPDSVALVSDERTWTFGQLGLAVSERADRLRSEGVCGETVVPLTADPDPDTILGLLSIWRVGATPAPLNSKLTSAERDAALRALEGRRSEAQAVLWTSGTEGRPRGVAISYRNLAASALASEARLGLVPGDAWLASLSPAHIGGLALVTRALLLGSRLVAVGAFDAARALDLIARGAVTHVSVVPTQLLRLLDLSADAPPPPTFRCALVGGARAPDGLVRRALDAGWPLALTYGLTEATSQVATAAPDLTRRKPGTVGKRLDGVGLTLAEDGEILVRGPTVATGYVGTDPQDVVDAGGWLHTGDIGRLDEEGDLWVTGRRSDRIVTGGVTVDAVEVEEALRAHAAVGDACVVGLPDAEWGERVAAWVVPTGEGIDGDALLAFLRGRLSGPKLPRVLHVGETLPRNPNGKVDRAAVRSVLEGLRSGAWGVFGG